jgi:dTDP-4-dehydrorhamnose reductase
MGTIGSPREASPADRRTDQGDVMRAVVVGGSGQIGGWLLRHLAARGHEVSGTFHTVPFPGLVHLDGSDLDVSSAWLREARPDLVFFPAGYTYVDGCQRAPARARAANVELPLALGHVAAELGARFVYFSTDYIFDGEDGPYAEADPPRAINVYGQSKLDAERSLTEALGDSALIVRTSWVYGPERQGKNFAYQLVRSLRQGRPLAVATDCSSNPSYGPDVAEVAVLLAERGLAGPIHVVGPEVMPRVEFARALARGFGLAPDLILGKTTSELGGGTPRPLAGGLRSDRLESLLPGRMRRVPAALDDFRRCLVPGGPWTDPNS